MDKNRCSNEDVRKMIRRMNHDSENGTFLAEIRKDPKYPFSCLED